MGRGAQGCHGKSGAQNGQKKNPGDCSPEFLWPLVDTLSGGVPKHPNGPRKSRIAHMFAFVKALRQKKRSGKGKGSKLPGQTLARSRYNGKAHGWTTAPGEPPGKAGWGPAGPPKWAPRTPEPPAGAAGRGGRRGEPHPPEEKRRGRSTRAQKRARGQKETAALAPPAPGRGGPGPEAPKGATKGGPAEPTRSAKATPKGARATAGSPQRTEGKTQRRDGSERPRSRTAAHTARAHKAGGKGAARPGVK